MFHLTVVPVPCEGQSPRQQKVLVAQSCGNGYSGVLSRISAPQDRRHSLRSHGRSDSYGSAGEEQQQDGGVRRHSSHRCVQKARLASRQRQGFPIEVLRLHLSTDAQSEHEDLGSGCGLLYGFRLEVPALRTVLTAIYHRSERPEVSETRLQADLHSERREKRSNKDIESFCSLHHSYLELWHPRGSIVTVEIAHVPREGSNQCDHLSRPPRKNPAVILQQNKGAQSSLQ